MTFPRRYTFWLKLGLAIGLIALSDWLIKDVIPGAGFGVVSLALVVALLGARPALWRNGLARAGLLVATAMALLQIERTSLLVLLFFATAIGVTTLAPRAGLADDAWRWWQRLMLGGLKALWGPVSDLKRLLKARARTRKFRIAAILAAAMLPVLGGVVFLSLFAVANPVIEVVLANLRFPELDIGRIMFWTVVGLPIWAVLRPRGVRRIHTLSGGRGEMDIPGVTTASVTVSLVVFNAIFAVQNGLDIAFLWSGAPLPDGVTAAQYVHRGAYPLIATALLAGLFVLVFLQPGSATAQARAPRVLVSIWVAQNLLLVISTAWRTLEYIDEYLLTRLRVAALLWMTLVAVGLALILWRMLRNKSASWLINTNALAAGVVLAVCCVIDLGAFAAAWNVTHAQEVGGRGESMDICHMRTLNGAAIVSLARMEQRPMPSELRERIVWTRRMMTADVMKRQADWRSWRWRDARRLAKVRALVGPESSDPPNPKSRNCNGVISPPQLTPPAQPGS